jgi:hypothetical protein
MVTDGIQACIMSLLTNYLLQVVERLYSVGSAIFNTLLWNKLKQT